MQVFILAEMVFIDNARDGKPETELLAFKGMPAAGNGAGFKGFVKSSLHDFFYDFKGGIAGGKG